MTRRRKLLTFAVVAMTVLVIATVLGQDDTSRERRATEGGSPRPATLTDPAVVQLLPDCSNAGVATRLDPGRDYEIRLPDQPLRCPLVIVGGRRVRVIGGAVEIPDRYDRGREQPADHYGLFLKNQVEEGYVEGLELGGPDLGTGIVLDQRLGARIVLHRIRIEGAHGHGYDDPAQYARYHSDCVQSYAGPGELLVAGLSCQTDNFGVQLSPQQYTISEATWPDRVDLRQVNIRSVGGSARLRYQLWRGAPGASLRAHGGWWPTTFEDVWLQPAARGGRSSTWMCMSDDYAIEEDGEKACSLYPGFHEGTPPAGDFVTDGSVGIAYDRR